MRPCVCVCMCVPRKSEWYECTWNMKWRQVRIEFPPGPYPDRSPDFKKGCSMAKHPLHPPATPSLCLQPFPVLPAFDNCGSRSPHRGGGTGHPHYHAAPQNRTPGGSPTNEPSDTLGFEDLTARWWMYGLSAAETSQAGMAGSDEGPTPLLAALGGWRSSFLSAFFRAWLTYAMTCYPLSPSWNYTAPIPTLLASMSMMNGRPASGYASTGAFVSTSRKHLKVASHASSQTKEWPFSVSWCSGLVMVEKFWTKHRQ